MAAVNRVSRRRGGAGEGWRGCRCDGGRCTRQWHDTRVSPLLAAWPPALPRLWVLACFFTPGPLALPWPRAGSAPNPMPAKAVYSVATMKNICAYSLFICTVSIRVSQLVVNLSRGMEACTLIVCFCICPWETNCWKWLVRASALLVAWNFSFVWIEFFLCEKKGVVDW
jgi:hypothetical protein